MRKWNELNMIPALSAEAGASASLLNQELVFDEQNPIKIEEMKRDWLQNWTENIKW